MASAPQGNRLRVGDIISQAISENRRAEWLLYGFATLFVLVGLSLIICGIVKDTVLVWAGVAESVLFVPAVLLARRTREQNMAVRLLEIPLRKARSADEAAKVLTRFFQSAFGFSSSPSASGTETGVES
jgi:hypothetical protein